MAMLTFECYEAAFYDEDEREDFFDQPGRRVKPGTAMRHILGINLGLFGSERELRRDAAEIMRMEVDTWAKENGEDRLGIPASAVERDEVFLRAFEIGRRTNRAEVERLLAGAESPGNPDAMLPPDPEIDHYLTGAFVRETYFSLCTIADKYQDEMRNHRERLSRIGIRASDAV